MSDRGKLKLGAKSDIVRCLEDVTEEQHDIPKSVEVVMLLGPDIVYVLNTAAAITSSECAQDVFLPYVEHQLGKAHSIDVVWDNYRPDYLKAQSRARVGNEYIAESSP